jgi:hypothetical protein
MENYPFTFKIEMEFVIIKFLFLEKRCYLPLILNSNDFYKRYKENNILKIIVENLEKTNGVTDVKLIPGGINTEDELSKVVANFLTENESQKIQYLNFYERKFDDNSTKNHSNYINIKYKEFMSFPVKVINDETDLDEFGPMPLPVILIE